MIFQYINGELEGFYPAQLRSLVRSRFNEEPFEFKKNIFAANTTDAYCGRSVHFYFLANDLLQGVEIFLGNSFFYDGVSLLDRTIEVVMRDLRSSNIVWTQDDLGFTLGGGRVGVYTPDLELGEQALVKSVYVNLMI